MVIILSWKRKFSNVKGTVNPSCSNSSQWSRKISFADILCAIILCLTEQCNQDLQQIEVG